MAMSGMRRTITSDRDDVLDLAESTSRTVTRTTLPMGRLTIILSVNPGPILSDVYLENLSKTLVSPDGVPVPANVSCLQHI